MKIFKSLFYILFFKFGLLLIYIKLLHPFQDYLGSFNSAILTFVCGLTFLTVFFVWSVVCVGFYLFIDYIEELITKNKDV